jgi:ribonuclease J
MREQVRLAVRKVSTRWTGKKPIVDVLLIEG